jgi:hypothetical protein
MSVKALFEGRFDDYFEACADRPEDLWFLIHVPKTAGSSLRTEIAARLRPDVNVEVDYHDLSKPYDQRREEAIDRFAAGDARSCRFASGHMPRLLVERVREVRPQLKLITLLRDPVERCLSDFRYQRTPAHPPHREFIQQCPTIKEFVALEKERNKLFKHLRKNWDDGIDQVIADLESGFAFVGLTELYALSFRLLFTLLRVRAAPTIYERKTADVPESRIRDLPRLRPMIEEANALDLQIWRHVQARYQAQRGALLEWLRRR